MAGDTGPFTCSPQPPAMKGGACFLLPPPRASQARPSPCVQLGSQGCQRLPRGLELWEPRGREEGPPPGLRSV